MAELDGVLVVLGDEVNHAGVHHVGIGAPEFLGGHIFARDLLDDRRASDEHLGLASLDDEVGQGRAVGCAAGTGAADQGDLWYRPG